MAMPKSLLIATALVQSSAAQTPLANVIELLKGMHEKAETERQAEKSQFATYKDWCTKEVSDMQDAIDNGADAIVVLNADIQTLTTSANNLQAQTAKIDADVVKWGQEIQASKDQRAKDKEVFDNLMKEYAESIEALDTAVEAVKGGQVSAKEGAALLELGSVDTIKLDKFSAFLTDLTTKTEQPKDKPAYEIGSTRVLKMLQKLSEKFSDEKKAAEKDESIAVAAFDKLQADLEDSVKTGTETSKKKVQERAAALQSASDKTTDKEDTEKTKADDTAYYKEVVSTCKQKASDYEDRTKLRNEEIATMVKAIDLISGETVSATAERQAAAGALLQTNKKTALAVMRRFLSISPSQDRAAKFLAAKAKELDSTLLSALALKASQDPMDKVKDMVKQLITKLEAETGLSEEQQIWCDKEMEFNEKARTKQSDAIESTTLGIETTTEEIAALGEDITDLTKSLADNAASLAEQTKQRVAEKATNDLTVSDAKSAQAALTQALGYLKDFYARSKGATSLVQTGAKKQLPKAPEIFEATYEGNQEGVGGGVVGMLETILSDYSKLETTTTANEKEASDSFDKMTSEGSQLKAQQESDLKHKTAKKSQKEEDKVNLQTDLSTAKKELASAMTYFDKLKDQCTAEGSRMKEREARRKAEIAGLQDALKLLDGEAAPAA
eukprot:TRINITY_DN9022_c0_g1_i1.p1 TRINITY_DN9022_c0_g1~~TRINITY_DN9022_c0_g1_i1.p1  ORF type:complete len:671 (-),score=244.26 TRINITY_DN9022_c0_g1_i1:121-2133(-)